MMAGQPGGLGDELTLADNERIDRICDAFEHRWRQGLAPRIEDFVRGMQGRPRSALLQELIATEVELRRKSGQNPGTVEYAERFPEIRDELQTIFAGVWRRETPTSTPDALAQTRLGGDSPTLDHDPTVSSGAGSSELAPGLRADASRCLVIDDYVIHDRIADRLGSGGMGIVYRAFHYRTRRNVALKLVRANWPGDTTQPDDFAIRARVRNEWSSLSRLEHDHIVPLYDVGHHSEVLYFAMKLIKGRDLHQIVKSEGPLEPRKAAYYLQAIARAVQYAHEQQILHRDIKPRNIMVDANDRPILIDLGLAKALDQTDYETVSGQAVGTAEYMSPEQARGEGIAFASDVYGLGATLFALLVGRAPFTGGNRNAILHQVLHEDPVWPAEARRRAGRDLVAICTKCLQKLPGERLPSAGDLADALGKYLRGEPTGIAPEGLWSRSKKWVRRQPWRAATLGVACLLGLGLVGGWSWRASIAREQAAMMVHQLQKVPLSEIGPTLEAIGGSQGWVDPLLDREIAAQPLPGERRSRLLVAHLPTAPAYARELAERTLAPGCSPAEYRLIADALRRWPEAALGVAARVLPSEGAPAAERGRAAALLLLTAPEQGTPEPLAERAWSLLAASESNSVRTHLGDWLVLGGIGPQRVLQRLQDTPEDSIRRMLLQILGGLGDGATTPPGLPEDAIGSLWDLYRNDNDPGVHSSLAYLFRRWGLAAALETVDAELAKEERVERRWFVNNLGMTFAVLDAASATEGKAISPRLAPADRIAMGVTEVPLRVLFASDPEYRARRLDENANAKDTPDAPAECLNYYDCMRFCNWLSRRDGLPESEWCYVPADVEGGLVLAPDYPSRSGYRIPSLSEWEFAARAGTSTERHYGDDDDFPRDHSWNRSNAYFSPKPIGLLQPNDHGLFDVIGNVLEWCQNPRAGHPVMCQCDEPGGPLCTAPGRQTLRGGAHMMNQSRQSSMDKGFSEEGSFPSNRWIYSGIRVVRRIRVDHIGEDARGSVPR